MEKVEPCKWWHNWLYLGQSDVICPKLGPFDPRTDTERTNQQTKYICVNCGTIKYKEIDYEYIGY